MRKDVESKKKEILGWIGERRSKAFICKQLLCKPITLETFLKKWNIVYGGNKGNEGFSVGGKQTPYTDYTVHGKYISSHSLKLKLIKQGVKEHRCEECKRKKWGKYKIPLELHHEDGNPHNNTLLNLRLLCPNCHALTDNHAGKGIKPKIKFVTEVVDGVELKVYFNSRVEKNREYKYNKQCVKCGNAFVTNSKKKIFCNKVCAKKDVCKIVWPEYSTLEKMVNELGYSALGRRLGVSDNAVRKRLQTHAPMVKLTDTLPLRGSAN